MYSFTTPKPKPLFAEDTKLWLIFISAVTTIIMLFSLFLAIKTIIYKNDIEEMEKNIEKNSLESKILTQKINSIKEKKSLYTKVVVDNQLLKDGVRNLLELIPDPITLTEVKIDKNSLYLYGITPSKEIYNILLLPSLKSIFNESKVNFYQMSNGWYRFESKNEMKEENDEF
jgi:hypothetical protein